VHVTCDQWMQRTNLGVLSVRSTSVKGVDAALKNYDAFPNAQFRGGAITRVKGPRSR
jgi:hypothetical protein